MHAGWCHESLYDWLGIVHRYDGLTALSSMPPKHGDGVILQIHALQSVTTSLSKLSFISTSEYCCGPKRISDELEGPGRKLTDMMTGDRSKDVMMKCP